MIFTLGLLLGAIASTSYSVPSNCACPYISQPVCGSDDITYPNPCALKCEQKQNQQLHLRYNGVCQAPKLKREAHPMCTCTRDMEQYCGTNGVTYNNLCLLECAAVTTPGLGIKYNGSCDRSENLEQPELEAKPNQKCVCNRNLQPVCGSNGITYNNECLLNCAAVGNALRVEHQGSCVVIATPGTGCSCSRDLKPVCGSDGVTYNNECILRCSNSQASVVKSEPC